MLSSFPGDFSRTDTDFNPNKKTPTFVGADFACLADLPAEAIAMTGAQTAKADLSAGAPRVGRGGGSSYHSSMMFFQSFRIMVPIEGTTK